MDTSELTAQMRTYFETGVTKTYDFRIKQLQKLKATVQKYETEIFEALYKDLHKSKEESYISENGFFLAEASSAIIHFQILIWWRQCIATHLPPLWG